jgi:hypothetical protein
LGKLSADLGAREIEIRLLDRGAIDRGDDGVATCGGRRGSDNGVASCRGRRRSDDGVVSCRR